MAEWDEDCEPCSTKMTARHFGVWPQASPQGHGAARAVNNPFAIKEHFIHDMSVLIGKPARPCKDFISQQMDNITLYQAYYLY